MQYSGTLLPVGTIVTGLTPIAVDNDNHPVVRLVTGSVQSYDIQHGHVLYYLGNGYRIHDRNIETALAPGVPS